MYISLEAWKSFISSSDIEFQSHREPYVLWGIALNIDMGGVGRKKIGASRPYLLPCKAEIHCQT